MKWGLVALLVLFGACTSEVIHNPTEAAECKEAGGTFKSNPDDPENTALCEKNWLAIVDDKLGSIFYNLWGLASIVAVVAIGGGFLIDKLRNREG